MTSTGRPIRNRITRTLRWSVLLLWALVQGSFAEAPETISHVLNRHGIDLTKPALVRALSNPDKEVRGFAAAELAEMKATEMLPKIMHAARIERDALTQVNIAAAATWLGSSDGLELLKRICEDRTIASSVRQDAARNVFDKGDHACFSAIANMMLPPADTDTRIGALYLLSQLHDRSDEETGRVLQSLLPALHDPDPRMRLEACEGLRWLKNAAAIAPLRTAIAEEPEETARESMWSALDSLVASQSQ